MWHFLVIYFAETYFINIEYYFFSCVLTLIISSFSYFIIERPLRKSNKIKKQLSYIFTKRKIFSISLIIFTTLFVIDYFNLKNKISRIGSKNIVSIFESLNIPKNSKLLLTQNKKLINNDCHEIYQNLDLLEQKKCYYKNNNEKLIYLFGDSHAWHFHPLFTKTKFKTDLILSSYNNSSFFKPIFKDTINPLEESDKVTKNLFKNLLSLSNKYSEIYLVLSFAHQTSYLRTNMSKKYFHEQEKYYLAFFNKLPKNIKIIFIKDTPIINHTESTCNAARYYNISFLDNDDRFKKCDYYKKNILEKFDKVYKMFENLSLQKSIYYLDFINYFCPTDSCNFYHPEKKFALIYDGKHLNYETSIDLSGVLKNQFSIILSK